MSDQGDILHYLRMEIDYAIRTKITFCQSPYHEKIFNRIKMTRQKPIIVTTYLGVENVLLFYNENEEKRTIT